MHVNVFDFSKLLAQSTERYLEFVRVSAFSVGIYVLDGGAMDHQKPHSEDEVYYVASGRAKMMINSGRDLDVLAARGRRILRLHIGADVGAGIGAPGRRRRPSVTPTPANRPRA